MSSNWQERVRPPCLERRFEFPNYPLLREFLDRAADLFENERYYPDMGFGRDYVNITIRPEQDGGSIEPQQRRIATRLDELAEESKQ